MKRTSEEKLSKAEKHKRALRVSKFWENKRYKEKNMANNTEETVTITKKEYDKLVRNSTFLSALYAAGVDSWEGFEIAQEELQD